MLIFGVYVSIPGHAVHFKQLRNETGVLGHWKNWKQKGIWHTIPMHSCFQHIGELFRTATFSQMCLPFWMMCCMFEQSPCMSQVSYKQVAVFFRQLKHLPESCFPVPFLFMWPFHEPDFTVSTLLVHYGRLCICFLNTDNEIWFLFAPICCFGELAIRWQRLLTSMLMYWKVGARISGVSASHCHLPSVDDCSRMNGFFGITVKGGWRGLEGGWNLGAGLLWVKVDNNSRFENRTVAGLFELHICLDSNATTVSMPTGLAAVNHSFTVQLPPFSLLNHFMTEGLRNKVRLEVLLG